MPNLTTIAVLAMGAVFCAVDAAPASAQVMKNFSWKKKPAKAKSHNVDAGQTQPVPKRPKTKSGN